MNNNKNSANRSNTAFVIGRSLRQVVRRFLWWAAGKSSATLETCLDPVKQRYTAIGFWVAVVVPVLAGFAMGEFLTAMKFGAFAATLGGLFWSFAYLGMERVMLTDPNHSSKRKNWLKAIPRFVLAICTSFLISDALIARAFRTSIDAELARTVDVSVQQKGQTVRTEKGPRVATLIAENERLANKLEGLLEIKREAERIMHDEADGNGGTFRKGEGVNYSRRQEAFQRATEDYDRERPIIESQILANKNELAAIDNEVKAAEDARRTVEAEATDPLARHDALMRLVAGSKSAALIYLVMFTLLATAELFALLRKLIADPDEYDGQVERAVDLRGLHQVEEHERRKRNIRRSASIQGTIQNRILEGVRHGRPQTLPEAEKGLGNRVYENYLHSAADEMCASPPPRTEGSPATGTIRLEVEGRPGFEVILCPSVSELQTLTLGDLESELDQISRTMDETTGRTYSFEKAMNSLGLEIWQDSPILPQLEPDRLAVLRFREDVGSFVKPLWHAVK